MIKTISTYKFSVLWLTLIFLACTVPDPGVPKPMQFVGFDKVAHFGLYGMLTLLLFIDGYRNNAFKMHSFKMVLVTVAFPVAFGAGIEYVQETYFPPRSAELYDFYADLAGSLSGYLFVTVWMKKWGFPFKTSKKVKVER